MKDTVEKKTKIILVVAIAVLVIIAGAGFWYWPGKEGVLPPPEPESLGEKIFEKAQNPIKDELPQTNPFETKSNPFETEVNPFQGVYKNPF